MLPPRPLWPDRVYTLPELQYGDRLNVAEELVTTHVGAGRGDHPAVIDGTTRVTFSELASLVNRIGHGLRSLGVAPGDRVMLRMPNSLEFVATWLAVQRIGAVSVSTMPMLKARELAYVVDDAEPRVVVVGADLLEELRAALERAAREPQVVRVGAVSTPGEIGWDELAAAGSTNLDPHPTGRDDLAIIAYTSGSTGQPKGACHSPSDILASADAYAGRILAPTPSDVFGGHPTLAFTYGLGAGIVFPFRFGASSVLLRKFTPEGLLEAVARERVTVLFCAATTYRMLLQLDLESRFDLRSLRAAVSAGEPLPRTVSEEWTRRTGVEVLDGLGSTEMFQIFVSQQRGAVRHGATGLPVPGYEVRIIDEQGHDVARGTPGLLAVRGPTGCRYWRQPERQREYVRNGWNVPNDICIEDEDGYFWYQCRNDDLIICAGYNVAGPEVEAVLLEHPAVLEAAVVASPDAMKGHVPKAFVVLKPGHAPSGDLVHSVQEHVKRELAPYKYPRKVEFIDALPKTETGKIRRVELRAKEKASVQ
jgi:2-aminobenzoate-CoA ligase